MCSSAINAEVFFAIKKAIKNGDKDFIFNCSNIKNISLPIINLITKSAELLKASGLRLKVKVDSNFSKFLKDSKLIAFVDIIKTV